MFTAIEHYLKINNCDALLFVIEVKRERAQVFLIQNTLLVTLRLFEIKNPPPLL